MGVDRKTRSITLSIKAKDYEEEAKVVEEYSRGGAAGTTSLGDLLKEHMDGDND
jgi:small subunit ribosomal protein S1